MREREVNSQEEVKTVFVALFTPTTCYMKANHKKSGEKKKNQQPDFSLGVNRGKECCNPIGGPSDSSEAWGRNVASTGKYKH